MERRKEILEARRKAKLLQHERWIQRRASAAARREERRRQHEAGESMARAASWRETLGKLKMWLEKNGGRYPRRQTTDSYEKSMAIFL